MSKSKRRAARGSACDRPELETKMKKYKKDFQTSEGKVMMQQVKVPAPELANLTLIPRVLQGTRTEMITGSPMTSGHLSAGIKGC